MRISYTISSNISIQILRDKIDIKGYISSK